MLCHMSKDSTSQKSGSAIGNPVNGYLTLHAREVVPMSCRQQCPVESSMTKKRMPDQECYLICTGFPWRAFSIVRKRRGIHQTRATPSFRSCECRVGPGQVAMRGYSGTADRKGQPQLWPRYRSACPGPTLQSLGQRTRRRSSRQAPNRHGAPYPGFDAHTLCKTGPCALDTHRDHVHTPFARRLRRAFRPGLV